MENSLSMLVELLTSDDFLHLPSTIFAHKGKF